MQRLRRNKGDGASTGKGQGTPLYVAADGKILDDSWQCLELLGPVPEEMKKAPRCAKWGSQGLKRWPGFEEIEDGI